MALNAIFTKLKWKAARQNVKMPTNKSQSCQILHVIHII
jgi:hypothetical protein